MPPDKLAAFPCYDPRDPAQSLDDRTTWKVSDNAILITATMLLALDAERTHIDWEKVAALADLCEAPELGTAGLHHDTLASRDETDAMLCAALARRPRRNRKPRLRPDAGCAPRRNRRKYGT